MFEEIDTPAVLVDLDIAEANISRFQAHCDAHGLAVRPHIKTHKLPYLAARQIAAGATGITCQKISEAEAMIAGGGIDDVLLTYNVIGKSKLARLRGLADRVRLTVVADNPVIVAGLSEAFTESADPLRVLVECDTGAARCGVPTPEAAAELADCISTAPGLHFAGLMTYPPVGREEAVQDWLARAKALIEAQGQNVEVVSNGGSPGMWKAEAVSIATEYRIGTYVYMDRSLVEQGVCQWGDCALTVLATVVSVPATDRAVIDAGSKVLTSDLLGLEGHGHVVERPDILVANLSEEHGVLTAPEIGLKVGDRIRIVPNHACVVSNMLDCVELIRGTRHQERMPVQARGQVW
ncbi:D-TA family PLP-dependent enzyme [Nitratireductor sp. XY-223]|uniref:D-TA family PLP-dependent enzyme n=1 Tax=Nitratireductor sp. XY-223 TaxID=2561926 RepID=UPI0010A9FB86|nr:D-TA family PLP-dependent enzyme [Nitratireductor sp. XY-223]